MVVVLRLGFALLPSPCHMRCAATLSAASDRANENLLSLTVSSPALLLNQMAERYSSTSRILMEYVDNSLVDAESFYDHVAGTYRRAVYIDVFVSNERRTLRIVDNCRGMPPDVLSRVVMRVGESKKRGVSLVNGQFGLGMQSFRAACSTLTVTSRAAGDNAYRICVEREQSDGFRIEVVDEVPALADLSGAAHTGTEVVLSGFDKQWIDGTFGPAAVAREVESHFERLLDRAALSVRVWDADQPDATPRRCQPIDYSRLSPGASVKLAVDLGFGQTADCNLCVLPGAANAMQRDGDADSGGGDGGGFSPELHASRFFVSGRRIAPCGATASFARGSAQRWTLWSNPNVLGYIDMRGARDGAREGPLQPVITRDEFKNTRHRAAAYAAIMEAVEPPLLEAIAAANAYSSERSFSTLEKTLTEVLAKVAADERLQTTELERLEKQAAQRRRRRQAALIKAEREAAAAAAALAAAEAAEAEVRPLTEKVKAGLGGLLSNAVRASGDALANALDPSRVAAEAAARAAREAEEAAKKAEDDERRAEARRQARRMKRQAPAAEQFSVRLVRGLEKRVAGAAAMDEAGAAELRRAVEAVLPPPLPRERSRLVGSTIFVDADHPDFQARWRQTHLGTTKLDDRLCGYLATIVSSHYRERAYQAADRSRVDYAQCYEEMLSTYCRLEEGLRAALPAMLKEMNEQGGFAA